MALKANLNHFLDKEGKVLALTEQANVVFEFLTKIVLAVTDNIEQSLIDVNLKCNTRADNLSCIGSIAARAISFNMIEWHCNTCEASGTISNWQGSHWDKQKRIFH